MDRSLAELKRLIDMVNVARWKGYPTQTQREDRAQVDAERWLENFFQTSRALAVYGTLAPGQPNHHVVAPLGGEWTHGVIEGELLPVGWGATLGYPAFRPLAGGAELGVQVLTSPLLATAWPELDAFEGAEYRRILIPVFRRGEDGERRLLTVANLYAAAEAARGGADEMG